MKRHQGLLLAAVAVTVLGGGWYASRLTIAPSGMIHVLVQVGEAGTHAVSVPAGTTALAATQRVAEVTIKGEGEAAVVSRIDGVAADQGKAWRLVVNGAYSSMNAQAYILQPGDKIRWVLRASLH